MREKNKLSAPNPKLNAHEQAASILRIERSAMPIGMAAMTIVVLGTWWFFAGKVSAVWLYSWLVYMAVLIATLAGANLYVSYKKPSVAEYLGFWGPLGKLLNLGMVLGAIASVWIFMPAADAGLRQLLITSFMGFVITNLMIHGEGGRLLSSVTILGVFGSLVAFLCFHPMPYSEANIGFLVLMSVTMMNLQSNFRKSTRQAIKERAVSEQVSVELDTALAAVIVERDTKTRFLESASHDLRQPLQAARMFFDQSQQLTKGAQHDKAVASLHWALEAADQSLTQILDHLRLGAGDIKASMRVFDVGPLIAHLGKVNEPNSQFSHTTIIVVESRLMVVGDPALVERALGNFITNALRHAHASRVLIGARRSGGHVRIWVIDDGDGIPETDWPTLFDSYVQGSNHGDEIRGGFGLGLASVARLAKLMNATAGLDTRWKNGSAFWLELRLETA